MINPCQTTRRIIVTICFSIGLFNVSSSQSMMDSKTLFDRANAEIAVKSYASAMNDLNRAIAIDSSFGDAYFLRASVKKGLKIDYCSDIKKASELGNDKATEIYKQFCRLISEEEIANRIFPDDSLSKLYPDRPEPLYNISNVYFEAKQYKKAIEFCDKAISVDPKYAPAYYNKGACLLNLEDYSNGCKLIYKAADMGDDLALQTKPQCDAYYHKKSH